MENQIQNKHKFYDICVDYPFLKVILNFSPTIIIALNTLCIYLTDLYWVNYKLLINIINFTITSMLLIIVLILLIIYEIGKTKYKKDMKSLEIVRKHNKFFYETIYTIMVSKIELIKNYFNSANDKTEMSTINIITKPKDQIEYLKSRIDEFILDFFEKTNSDKPKTKYKSNIIYKCNDENWQWFETPNLPDDKSIEKLNLLIKDENSALNKIVNGKINVIENGSIEKDAKEIGNFLFFNDKVQAHTARNYTKDTGDKNNSTEGSILCYQIDVTSDNCSIKIIYVISTYGEKFITKNVTDDDIKKFRNFLQEQISKTFEEILKFEFIFYYLEKENTKK